MAITADYDHVGTFTADPVTLTTRGNNLKDLGQAVADSIDRINKTWNDLKLGWMGDTADEAKAFVDRWNVVMGELFGSDEHPEKGALNEIVTGVLTTAWIFGQTEHTLAEFFNDFKNGLAGGGGPSDTPPSSVTDTTNTAVTETWG
jgi:hypothetical protein